jgi:ketosteroid isomerase-like protein
MKRRFTIPVVLTCVVLALTACSNSNDSSSSGDATALATELIDQYAKAVFERDQEALGELLADAYILRRADGSGYDREGYVNALAQGSDYELVDYSISDVTAQQDGDILVATFTLQGDIEEGGRSVISEPSPSLVTFVRVDGEWKLASDAFFSQ